MFARCCRDRERSNVAEHTIIGASPRKSPFNGLTYGWATSKAPAKMWSNTSNTHDASASAEVVLGPKICLYWNRDGPDVAGLAARGAAHMIRLTWAIAALTLVMLLGLGLQIYLAFHPPISPVLAS